jgi:hypothetical protein
MVFVWGCDVTNLEKYEREEAEKARRLDANPKHSSEFEFTDPEPRRPKPIKWIPPAQTGEILPPVKPIPTMPAVIDAYAQHAPKIVQQVTTYEAGPITRAQAMTMKANQITKFLAVMTGAAMVVFQLYPASLGGLGIFLLWLVIASAEWCLMFAMLAILDYRETPSAQGWFQMKSYTKFMRDEQQHRLRAMYPDQYDEQGRRKWQ